MGRLPEPMRDLAIPLAAEDSVTELPNAGNRRPHNWALRCKGNDCSCRILMRRELQPTFVSCHQGQHRAPERVWMVQGNLSPSPHRTQKGGGGHSPHYSLNAMHTLSRCLEPCRRDISLLVSQASPHLGTAIRSQVSILGPKLVSIWQDRVNLHER
jgi:hypothetical protein